jgi:topoisomerase-4 subunit A
MYLGEFVEDDRILVITTTGDYYTTTIELTAHFDQNIWRIEKFDRDKVWSLAMWNADLGYYYGKRFQLDAQAKSQNMLGENTDSKMTILTDREEATFQLSFVDETKATMEVLMSEFIEVKSAKAKGKRFATWEVAKIEDITPEPEVVEEIAEDESGDDNEAEDNSPETTDSNETKEETAAPVVDVPFTITNEVPEDSKPVADQLSLF